VVDDINKISAEEMKSYFPEICKNLKLVILNYLFFILVKKEMKNKSKEKFKKIQVFLFNISFICAGQNVLKIQNFNKENSNGTSFLSLLSSKFYSLNLLL
jgi:hypothetical protein